MILHGLLAHAEHMSVVNISSCMAACVISHSFDMNIESIAFFLLFFFLVLDRKIILCLMNSAFFSYEFLLFGVVKPFRECGLSLAWESNVLSYRAICTRRICTQSSHWVQDIVSALGCPGGMCRSCLTQLRSRVEAS